MGDVDVATTQHGANIGLCRNFDFWPPLQEEWRCLDQSKSFDYVMETHDLLVHSPVHNPEYAAYQDFDCPVIDPTESETWCTNGADFFLFLVTAMPTIDALQCKLVNPWS